MTWVLKCLWSWQVDEIVKDFDDKLKAHAQKKAKQAASMPAMVRQASFGASAGPRSPTFSSVGGPTMNVKCFTDGYVCMRLRAMHEQTVYIYGSSDALFRAQW